MTKTGFFMLLILGALLAVIVAVQGNRKFNEHLIERCFEQAEPQYRVVNGPGGLWVETFKECLLAGKDLKTREEIIIKREKISDIPKEPVPKINKKPAKSSFLPPAPRKVGATARQQYMINYAWRVSGGDEKFLTMVEAESRWVPTQWEKLNGGKRGHGFGLCQVDDRYWAEVQNEKAFQTNWAHQVHDCLKLWRAGVKFYGADRNSEMISRFWWPSHEA